MPSAWLLCAAAALFPLAFDFGHRLEDFSQLPQQAALQFAAWTALALALTRAKAAIPLSRLAAAAAALLAWSALSYFWAHNRYEAFLRLAHWSACFAAGWAAVLSAQEKGFAPKLETALAASGAAAAALGLLQLAEIPWAANLPQVQPPASLFAHRNLAAEFAGLTLPFALAGWLGAKSNRPAAFFALAMSVDAAFLAACGSRAGLLALLASLAVFFFLAGKEKIRPSPTAKKMGTAAAALALGLTLALGSRAPGGGAAMRAGGLAEAAITGEADASISLRWVFWRNALAMWADRPLAGFGLGNFAVHYPAYQRAAAMESVSGEFTQLSHAHNDAVELAVELGAAGFLLLLFLLWEIIKRASRLEGIPAVEFWAFAAAFVVFAGAGFPLYTAAAPFLAALTLAKLFGSEKRLAVPGFAARMSAAACAALAALSFGWSGKRLSAERWYSDSRRFALEGRLEDAADAAETAGRLQPERKRLRFEAGRAYAVSGRMKEAAALYAEIAQAYPHHFGSLLNLGLAETHLGRFEAAEAALKRALELDPNSQRAQAAWSKLQQARKGS